MSSANCSYRLGASSYDLGESSLNCTYHLSELHMQSRRITPSPSPVTLNPHSHPSPVTLTLTLTLTLTFEDHFDHMNVNVPPHMHVLFGRWQCNGMSCRRWFHLSCESGKKCGDSASPLCITCFQEAHAAADGQTGARKRQRRN